MNSSLWVIRIFFVLLCTFAGYAVSQSRPDIINGSIYGVMVGFGLSGGGDVGGLVFNWAA